jgi:hypothetical protein
MKVLGGHILRKALNVVGYEEFPMLKYSGRTKNAAGLWVPIYVQTANIKAQVQAVSRNQMQYQGLDFEKNYIMVYTEYPIQDIQRDGEADRMIYGGNTFEFLNASLWKKPQGFVGGLAVQV